MSTATEYRYLAPNPKSSYKQLFVKGTRVSARALYGCHVCAEPRSPEEIAEDYALPVEAVKEAIRYCQSNPAELAEDYEREERLLQAAGMNDPNYKFDPSPRLLTPQEIASINRS